MIFTTQPVLAVRHTFVHQESVAIYWKVRTVKMISAERVHYEFRAVLRFFSKRRSIKFCELLDVCKKLIEGIFNVSRKSLTVKCRERTLSIPDHRSTLRFLFLKCCNKGCFFKPSTKESSIIFNQFKDSINFDYQNKIKLQHRSCLQQVELLFCSSCNSFNFKLRRPYVVINPFFQILH